MFWGNFIVQKTHKHTQTPRVKLDTVTQLLCTWHRLRLQAAKNKSYATPPLCSHSLFFQEYCGGGKHTQTHTLHTELSLVSLGQLRENKQPGVWQMQWKERWIGAVVFVSSLRKHCLYSMVKLGCCSLLFALFHSSIFHWCFFKSRLWLKSKNIRMNETLKIF